MLGEEGVGRVKQLVQGRVVTVSTGVTPAGAVVPLAHTRLEAEGVKGRSEDPVAPVRVMV